MGVWLWVLNNGRRLPITLPNWPKSLRPIAVKHQLDMAAYLLDLAAAEASDNVRALAHGHPTEDGCDRA
jgi:hypothetical protein